MVTHGWSVGPDTLIYVRSLLANAEARECLAVNHGDRLHLINCLSPKFRFRTGDWFFAVSGTPQVHAHVGRTVPRERAELRVLKW